MGFDEKAPKLWSLALSRAVSGGRDGWASTDPYYLPEFCTETSKPNLPATCGPNPTDPPNPPRGELKENPGEDA